VDVEAQHGDFSDLDFGLWTLVSGL
jgi:hypothetical protein